MAIDAAALALAACAACHGADGLSALPEVPSLAGQPRLFTENTLVLMREGLREAPGKAAVLKGLGDGQLIALARHYEALPAPVRDGPVKPALARAGAAASARGLCGTCHLPDYRGQQQVPRLAGQNEAYLLASMKAFRDAPGAGRDTIMAGTLRGLPDAELAALAHYFALFPRSAPAR